MMVTRALALVLQCVPSAPNAEPPREAPPMVRGFNISGTGDDIIPDAAKWGVDVLRLQVFPINRAQRWHKPMWDAWPIVLDSVEDAVKRAGALHIKVVVDLHEAPVEGVKEGTPDLWKHPDLANNFCRAWADLARRLLPYREYIWGYDLYNEPYDKAEMPDPPKAWRGIAEQVIRTIRSIDRETWIVYESGPGSTMSGLDKMEPFSDHRVVYSGHVYDPTSFTNQNAGGTHTPGTVHYTSRDRGAIEHDIEPALRFEDKHHVPIFIGEFSVIRWAPHNDAVQWLKDAIELFERHHWSWAYHTFRDYNGWSLEVDDNPPWAQGDPEPKPVNYITDRGKVLKEALAKNHEK